MALLIRHPFLVQEVYIECDPKVVTHVQVAKRLYRLRGCRVTRNGGPGKRLWLSWNVTWDMPIGGGETFEKRTRLGPNTLTPLDNAVRTLAETVFDNDIHAAACSAAGRDR